MSNTNGHAQFKFEGVWALLGLVDGSTLIAKFMGFTDRADVEKALADPNNMWAPLENAYHVLIQPATNGQGVPVIMEICLPYFQSLDEKQAVSVQVRNISSMWFVDEMSRPMQEKLATHVTKANQKIQAMRAAAVGVQIAR